MKIYQDNVQIFNKSDLKTYINSHINSDTESKDIKEIICEEFYIPFSIAFREFNLKKKNYRKLAKNMANEIEFFENPLEDIYLDFISLNCDNKEKFILIEKMKNISENLTNEKAAIMTNLINFIS